MLGRQSLGGLLSVTVRGLTADERAAAASAGLELVPVSLQQLIVRLTTQKQEVPA